MRSIRSLLVLTLAGAGSLALASPASAHCQIPCGIYDDAMRIDRMREDAATIEKAVKSLADLTPARSALDLNQAARWVAVKEDHASRIIETTSEYFLTQKLKPASGAERAAYLETLADHHALMRAAMKTKQTVDPDAVRDLRAAIDAVAERWLEPEDGAHAHSHAHSEKTEKPTTRPGRRY